MRLVATMLALTFPLPLAAQLTTLYAGTQVDRGKTFPASAQFSVETGRVAMLMKGSQSNRMLFDAKTGVLRIVSDEHQSYFDIDQKGGGPGDPSGMMATMQKQLEKLPKEQRAMAEQMMKSTMASAPTQPQLVYEWTKEKQTVLSYDCLMVHGMRGTNKVTEYCGSTSPDFAMTPAERETILSMQGLLRNFSIMVKSGDESRAFQWDTNTDGYPVITRCFRDGQMTLDLKLESLNRKPIPDSLFVVPNGYKKMDFSRMGQ